MTNAAPDVLPATVQAPSRRRLFQSLGGSAVAAFWAAASAPRAAASDASADVDPGALTTKLVRRLTMGLTEAELNLAASLGYQGYLERHLNPASIDDSALNALPAFANLGTLNLNPVQLFPLPAGQVINELTQAAILRAVFSNRQLFERMVEFWTDHFNIDITNGDDRWLKTVDDRAVVRPHALGNFGDLLAASAQSPAMLYYLNNTTSIAGNPNENYARELMELHTMGVDGGYTQQDVVEVARCFTGWGMYPRNAGALAGTFRYNPVQHDNGQKTVLGNIIPAGGGMQDGFTVLNILLDHPATAQFLARKLCRWLLAEQPPASAVADVAAAYTSTGGDIKAMIRAALAPNYLHDAPPKYKRPFHLNVSALRALGATITSTSAVIQNLLSAGHRPFYWGPPDGYPDTLVYWSGLILPRWSFGASLGNGNVTGSVVDVAAFFAGATTAQQMVDRLDQRLFAGEMSPADKQRVRDYLLPDPPTLTRQRDAIGLAVGSPGFQWY